MDHFLVLFWLACVLLISSSYSRTVRLAQTAISRFRTSMATVLMRWPYKQDLIGLNRSKATLYKYLALSRVGRYEAVSRTDGHRRLVVYRQIADLPLVLSVGQSTEYIYANWSQAAIAIGALAAALCAIAFWLTVYLIRELKRRKKAEMK